MRGKQRRERVATRFDPGQCVIDAEDEQALWCITLGDRPDLLGADRRRDMRRARSTERVRCDGGSESIVLEPVDQDPAGPQAARLLIDDEGGELTGEDRSDHFRVALGLGKRRRSVERDEYMETL